MSNRPERPPRPDALPRLYAILDVDALTGRGLDPDRVAKSWLDSGIRLLQLRAKLLTFGPFVELAARLAEHAHAAGATFLVNDRADVAALAGAGGVHVGQEDLSPADVRHIVGSAAVVGLSTHNAEQAGRALAEPIDYLAIGPVFGTATKTSEWAPLGLAGVSATATLARGRLPIVAIGGITLASSRDVIEAGAASVAVISDLLVGDPGRRAREFLTALA